MQRNRAPCSQSGMRRRGRSKEEGSSFTLDRMTDFSYLRPRFTHTHPGTHAHHTRYTQEGQKRVTVHVPLCLVSCRDQCNITTNLTENPHTTNRPYLTSRPNPIEPEHNGSMARRPILYGQSEIFVRWACSLDGLLILQRSSEYEMGTRSPTGHPSSGDNPLVLPSRRRPSQNQETFKNRQNKSTALQTPFLSRVV